MSGLAVRESNTSLDQIEALKIAVKSIGSIAHTIEAQDQAKAIGAYAQAKKSRELLAEAMKLRMYAERRAGQLARQSGVSFKQIADEYDVNRVDARRWVTLAFFDDASIDEALTAASERGSYYSIYNKLLCATAERVERDIYKLADDSYEIRWKIHGRTYSRKISGKLKTARAALIRARNNSLPDPKARSRGDLSNAYGSLRRCLLEIDAALPDLNQASRKRSENAMAFLHRAEDELVRAIKEFDE